MAPRVIEFKPGKQARQPKAVASSSSAAGPCPASTSPRQRRPQNKPLGSKLRFIESARRRARLVSVTNKQPAHGNKPAGVRLTPPKKRAKTPLPLSPPPQQHQQRQQVAEPPSSTFQLPRHLVRPPHREVDIANVLAVDPELAETPLQYIRDILHALGPRMLAALAATTAAPAGPNLPKDIEVCVREATAETPTHMLAVHTRHSTFDESRKVTLLPTHSIVLATHCANLPPLPPSKPGASDGRGAVRLPVVPINIPSPPMFPPLCAYLYTKRADQLLAALLPMPPAPPAGGERDDANAKTVSLQSLAEALARDYSGVQLLQYAMGVNGLWRNVCALGVHDDKLWSTMNVAWEVILAAMAMEKRKTLEEPAAS